MQKTIAIDARFYNEAGPGRYTKAIIQQLEKLDTQNNFLIFVRKRGMAEYLPTNPKFKKILADYRWYSFQEQTSFLAQLIKSKPDLLYVPHFNIPVLYPGKLITAIPDLIIQSYSTERGSTPQLLYYKVKRFVYFLVVLWAIFRSEKVIVPSASVKNEFIATYPFFPKSKFVIAYEGVDPDLITSLPPATNVLEEFNIRTPYLLYVGSMYKHKNVGKLLQAFELLQKKGFIGDLVLVGKRDYFSEQLFSRIKANDAIKMPGLSRYISDAEAMHLRKNALLYVFPSLKEGFSLTPLEAQAVGLPCVISDIPCHKEIYGDSVAYFDPNEAEAMSEKLWQVLNSLTLQENLTDLGLKNVKKYSWEQTAKITKGIYEASLNS